VGERLAAVGGDLRVVADEEARWHAELRLPTAALPLPRSPGSREA
jgi:hypothetical protein